jgi:hypothetical protein
MAKKIDPKAKAKRQKIIAGVGGVILLGVLAFQVPRTLKMMHPSDSSSSSSSAPAATSPATTTPTAAPSLGGGNATAAAPTGSDGLIDADAPPPPESGQLLAFGLFRTKDPFKQQLQLGGSSSGSATGSSGGAGAAGATGTGAPTGAAAPSAPAPKSGGGSAQLSAGQTPAQNFATASPTGAEISVNGVSESVSAGGVFPTSNPYFKVVKLTAKRAKISIAGGSLASGAPTVTLTKGKALTLMNTADGTRYVLRLLSTS